MAWVLVRGGEVGRGTAGRSVASRLALVSSAPVRHGYLGSSPLPSANGAPSARVVHVLGTPGDQTAALAPARREGAGGARSSGCVCSFQVDIRFPQSGAPDPNCVTVTGLPENVEEAIDHILNLEEEYVSAGAALGVLGGARQASPPQTDPPVSTAGRRGGQRGAAGLHEAPRPRGGQGAVQGLRGAGRPLDRQRQREGQVSSPGAPAPAPAAREGPPECSRLLSRALPPTGS